MDSLLRRAGTRCHEGAHDESPARSCSRFPTGEVMPSR
jgi:hypothetical protein